MERFCVFHTGDLTQKEFWTILKHGTAESVWRSIVRIQRINQPNGHKRIDIWVKKVNSAKFKQMMGLDSLQRRKGLRVDRRNPIKLLSGNGGMKVPLAMKRWRVDYYRDYRDRERKFKPPVGPIARSFPTGIATININGLKQRKEELFEMMRRGRIAVLALQETLLYEGSYALIHPEYQIFNRPAKDGFRGQAILVHKSYNAYEVTKDRSDFFTHIRVSGLSTDSGPWHFICFYLPSGGNMRSIRTRAFNAAINLCAEIEKSDKDARIIMLGDANLNEVDFAKKLRTMRTGLSVLKVSGSSLTFHRKGTKWSSIDHIITNKNSAGFVQRAKV
ncbi:Endonuclease/exonuclease/phosphatase, partial [Lentinula raphanica]